MEWYKRATVQTFPSPIPKFLSQLCLQHIHDNFTHIPTLSHLPTNILQQIQQFMMQARMMGSRFLNDANAHKLMVPNLEELNLAGFWICDKPFLEHYDCSYLTSLNLYVPSAHLALSFYSNLRKNRLHTN